VRLDLHAKRLDPHRTQGQLEPIETAHVSQYINPARSQLCEGRRC
jgi:hypothetical protein